MSARAFWVSSVLVVVVLAAACGGSRSDSESPATESPPEARMVVTGILTPTVEAGGWLLETDEQEYLLLEITEFRKADWFREGARVQVAGEEDPGAVTIYMQGKPLRVIDMQPVGDVTGGATQ